MAAQELDKDWNEYNDINNKMTTDGGDLLTGTGTDVTRTESDGTEVAEGDATCWEDLRFPATQAIAGFIVETFEPAYDLTNNGLLMPQNDATQIARGIAQFPHSRKTDSNIRPHIHYIQSQATAPTFKLQYRWYNNGDTVPGTFTEVTFDNPAFTWSSGDLLQIVGLTAEIDGTGKNLSSILDWRVFRDDNNVTGDVLLKEFDIHYEVDMLGSREEFVK